MEYCNETVEKLLDVDVQLSCLENRLLFCYDNTIDKRIKQFAKQLDSVETIRVLPATQAVQSSPLP